MKPATFPISREELTELNAELDAEACRFSGEDCPCYCDLCVDRIEA